MLFYHSLWWSTAARRVRACACVRTTGVSGESVQYVADFERFRALGFEVAARVEIFPTPTTVLNAPLLSEVFEEQSETRSASPTTRLKGGS